MTNVKISPILFAILVPMTVISVALDAEENIQQERGLTKCAFFKQAGLRCHSCYEVLACLPFNIAIAKTCPSEKPYCEYGKCSTTKGYRCFKPYASSTTAPATSVPDSTTSSSSNSEFACDSE